MAIHEHVDELERREAAAVTFAVTAAGVGFLGIGSAFWGLLAGGVMTLLHRCRAREPERQAASQA